MSFITKKQYNDIINTFTILDEQYWSFFKVYDRATRDKETTVNYLDYSGDPYVNPLISAEYLFKDESTNIVEIGFLVGMYLVKQKIGDWTLANLMAFSNACCIDIENIRILLDVIEEFGTNISNMENTTVTLNFIRTTKCIEVCKDKTQYGFYDQVLDMMGYLDNNTLESVINTKKLRNDIKSLVKDLQNLKDSVISLTVEE